MAERRRTLGQAAALETPHRPAAPAGRQPAQGQLILDQPVHGPRQADSGGLDGRSASVSTLERKLDSGVFVVTAEMPVIDGGGHAELQRQLEFMRPYVDAYNATENPGAHAHVAPLAISIGLLQVGAEPVMQLVCRDKNRLALEADLMGAAMYGVENICCLTGDDVTAGDEPEARRVFDLDGIQLIALARTLERGHYLSGRPIGADGTGMRFCVGAVENPSAPPLDHRIRRAAKKALAGARFLHLQM